MLQTNTFQCVVATDGQSKSYVIYLYADGMIQWTTGDNDGGVNGLGGTPAQVGINKGDGLEAVIANGSRTSNIINIDNDSNVGTPGVFIFDISEGTAPVGESYCVQCIYTVCYNNSPRVCLCALSNRHIKYNFLVSSTIFCLPSALVRAK